MLRLQLPALGEDSATTVALPIQFIYVLLFSLLPSSKYSAADRVTEAARGNIASMAMLLPKASVGNCQN